MTKGERNNIIRLSRLNEEDPEWLADCVTSETGRPLPNLANALAALRADPAADGLLAYDEMLHAAMLRRPLAPDDDTAAFTPRPLTDVDVSLGAGSVCNGSASAARQGHCPPSRRQPRVESTLSTPCATTSTALTWDGVPRLPHWLD